MNAHQAFSIAATDIVLDCADGVELPVTVRGPISAEETRGTVLIAGALGAPERFYHCFANHLAAAGYQVLTFNYRGNLGHGVTPDLRLYHWGYRDLPAVIDKACDLAGDQPVYFLGHSIGAQLMGLALNAARLSGAVFVAGSFPNWRRWPDPASRFKMWLLFRGLIPGLGRLRKDFPARLLGLAPTDLPSVLLQDWAEWACEEDYLLAPRFGLAAIDRYRNLSFPILALEFDDDTFVPREAAAKLYASYGAAKVEIRHKAASGLGHFGFFRREAGPTCWDEVVMWFESE